MRWLNEFLRRLPIDDVRRRAFGETLADWRVEARSVRGHQRARAAVSAVAAILRIAGSTFGSLGGHPMRSIGRDVRYAWRRLRAAPLFALFAIVTMALGIGATTAVYSMVQAVIGPPSGVRHAERVVNVYNWRLGASPSRAGMSWPDFLDFRARQTSFETVTAWSFFGGAFVGDAGSASGFAEVVDGNYFNVLGVQVQRGRALQPADDRPDAPLVAVIGHGLWQRLYGGAADVVGRLVRINGEPFEIVGIAPREFRGVFNNGLVPGAAWVPIAAVRVLEGLGRRVTLNPHARDTRWLMVKGLLVDGVTMKRAAAELTSIGRQLDETHPIDRDLPAGRPRSEIQRAWFPRRMTDVRFDSEPEIVDALTAALALAVGVVLLVACTNVGNMALARGSARAQEVAVRTALGASRWRLVRESLIESLMLAAAGGLAGLGVAQVIVTAVSREVSISGTAATLYLEPRLDGFAIAAGAAAALVALAVSGIGPAVISTRANVRAVLASEGSGTMPRWRGRRYLITAQVTASVVLLSIAALAARELRGQQQHDPGFDLDRLAVARVRFESQGYDDVRARQVLDAARAMLAGRADVERVALASDLQAVTGTGSASIKHPGDDAARRTAIIAGTPDLLETIGVRLLHGRAWRALEAAPEAAEVVLSEWAARTLFDVANVVGRTVLIERGGDERRFEAFTVVGVAADTDVRFYGYGDGAPAPLVYVPFGWAPPTTAIVVARGEDPSSLVPVVRQAFATADPGLAIDIADTARHLAGATTLFFGIVAGIASLLGSFAWVLALGGLSGILAHLVHRRTREIGLRVALGAPREQIVRMIVREGLSPVILGVIAGLTFGGIARSMVRSQMRQLLPGLDLAVLAVVPLLFICAAVLACYLPARRAAAVDPIAALRDV